MGDIPSPDPLAVMSVGQCDQALQDASGNGETQDSKVQGKGGNGADDVPASEVDVEWKRFCDRQATASANQFFHFLLTEGHHFQSRGFLPKEMTLRQLNKHYLDTFQKQFQALASAHEASLESTIFDFMSSQSGQGDNEGGESSRGLPARQRRPTLDGIDGSEMSDDQLYSMDPDSPSLLRHFQRKNIFRRFSLQGLIRGKGIMAIFHKQHSDEVELSNGDVRSSTACTGQAATMPSPIDIDRLKCNKNRKTSRIVVDLIKEGNVNFVAGEGTMDGKPNWEKSKLRLVKSSGGYLLEFISPPKSSRPKHGILCCLLIEARETTTLEMPDTDNVFVLKTECDEFLVEAVDSFEMKSWLSSIKSAMRQYNAYKSIRMGMSDSHSLQMLRRELTCMTNSTTSEPLNLMDLPPRVAKEFGAAVIGGSSNFLIDDLPEPCNMLNDFPWFHGTLSRSDAAHLILHESITTSTDDTANGIFLVRQSETRKGELVLTFNFQGRAKHLRLLISPEDGQCRVQHLWFSNIFDMLEHFRLQPVPLESGATSDVRLTNYVLRMSDPPNTGNGNGNGGAGATAAERMIHSLPEPMNQVYTYSGSVRTKARALNLIQEQMRRQGRARDNTYSFV